MDDHQLDDIARSLASATSRRTFVRAMVGAATAGLLGLTGRAAGAAKPEKVAICHRDNDNGSYKIIEVSEKALPAHLKHGDEQYVNCCTDVDCGSGAFCDGGRCSEDICHFFEDGSYLIMENVRGNDLVDHFEHGDTRYFTCCIDDDCDGNDECSDGGCVSAGQANPT